VINKKDIPELMDKSSNFFMKRILFYLFFTIIFAFLSNIVWAQNIGINVDGSPPNPNAMLDVKAFNKGILIPRTSTTSRTAIPNTKGLLVYDTTANSFYYNDGSAWQQISNGSASLNGTVNYLSKFTGTTKVGNSQIVDNGQYVGIGTNTPTAGLNIIHDGGIIAKGDTLSANNYTLRETGTGSKFIWYPKRGSFRSGFLDATYGFLWDDQYIGNWSTALGYDEFATGAGSLAAGYQTSSQGSYSFSEGFGSQATRIASIAMGYNAKAEGDYSFAQGNGTVAVGISSVAMGNATATQGNYSFALGNNTYSGGDYSFASGNGSHATGISSVAMGDNAQAAQHGAVALGYNTLANSLYSFAAGTGTKANGEGSVAIGEFSTANGAYSVALGYNAYANFAAVALGLGNNATGSNSFAMGNNATASGSLSVAMGTNIVASGSNSMIFGANLFDAGHKGNEMFGDTDPWNAGSVGSGTDDQMICRFNNGYYFITGGNTNRTGILANHGDNSWSAISDSTKKEKVLPVDGEGFLYKISQFKLGTWNYKGQDAKTFRHYGPMAQDFHNAFGHDAFGNIGCDTLINQQDFLGVSFIAIQALEKRTEKIEEQQKQILVLQKENVNLSANNEMLQQQLQLLLSTVSTLGKKVQALADVQNNSSTVVKK
jgi:Head domain of trimeric autotransporter adhesin/Chaperone of endosialidase